MRLKEYYEKTMPLLDLFERKKNMLLRINAYRPIPDVYADIRKGLGLGEPRKKAPAA